MIQLKSASQISNLKKAGEITALTHQLLAKHIVPGITTLELDRLAEQFIRSKGATPSFLGYHGFPNSICASVNDVVIHGIPNDVPLKEGDIVGIDVGAYLNGYHGDQAVTYPVGNVSKQAKRLIKAAEGAFYAGLEHALEGNRVLDISAAVQQFVEAQGFSVVREFVGHGVGTSMHEDPEIPNFGTAGKGPRLYAGMTFALEPMINSGGREIQMLADGWTVKTLDGSLSAHFEHTIAITKGEPILLTVCE